MPKLQKQQMHEHEDDLEVAMTSIFKTSKNFNVIFRFRVSDKLV